MDIYGGDAKTIQPGPARRLFLCPESRPECLFRGLSSPWWSRALRSVRLLCGLEGGGPSGSGGLSEPQSSRLTSVIGASTRSSSSSSSSKSDSSLSGGDALPRSALAARAGDLGMAGRVSLLGDRELRGRPPRDLAVSAFTSMLLGELSENC